MGTQKIMLKNQALGAHSPMNARRHSYQHAHRIRTLVLGALGCAVFALFSHDAKAAPKTPPAPVAAPEAPGSAIYKWVDASGRVSYSNTPVKGANKVELEAITVIPSSPAGILGQSTQPTVAEMQPSPLLIPVLPGIEAPTAAPTAPVLTSASTASTVAPTRAVAQVSVVSANTAARLAPVSSLPAPTFNANMAVKAAANTTPALMSNVVANVTTDDATSPNPHALPVVKLRPDGAPKVAVNANATPEAFVTPPIANPSVQVPVVATSPQAPAPVVAPALIQTSQQAPQHPPLQIPITIPAAPNPEAVALAKREEARQKIVMSNITGEERLLTEVKAQLALERRQSDSMRAMRTSMVASANDPAKASTNAEIKTQVERHFERVRDLQDQVAMHERNIAQFQQKLRGENVAAR
jgi:hypothetical protein